MHLSDLSLDFQSWSRWRRYSHTFPLFLDSLKPTKEDIILDIGAGTCVIADHIASICDEVFALEPQDKRVDYARRKFPQVKVFQSSVENIPFPENYFTKIYSINAFHHFTNSTVALSEFYRISKRNSLLLIQELTRDSILARLEKRFSKYNFETPESLQEKIELGGFEMLRVEKVKQGYLVLSQKA
jgi:ubiquinone/menaquinone biosynthesis C-methylase UbiE